MSVDIDPLEMQMLRALQDGDVATGRMLTDELRSARARINELEAAQVEDPVDRDASVQVKQQFYQAAAVFATEFPDVLADEHKRAFANQVDSAWSQAEPAMPFLQRMRLAGTAARARFGDGTHELDSQEAIRAMQAEQRRRGVVLSNGATALESDDADEAAVEAAVPDEDSRATMQTIAKMRAGRMPHNIAGQKSVWDDET